jgi:hypothetical protein
MIMWFIVIGSVVFLLVLSTILRRPNKVIEIDGATIQLREMWKDVAFVEYSEPLRQTLTFEAYWITKGDANVLRVEFPVELSFDEGRQPRKQETIEHLDIPDTPSERLLPKQRAEVKNRVSQGLTKLKIAHEFVAPQRSGWTSFEDGKEIYHG